MRLVDRQEDGMSLVEIRESGVNAGNSFGYLSEFGNQFRNFKSIISSSREGSRGVKAPREGPSRGA